MKGPFTISAFLAVVLSAIGTATIYFLINADQTTLVITFLSLLTINCIILFFVFEILFYKQLRNLLNTFKQLKNQRLDEIVIVKGVYRLPIFKKIFKRAYRHFYRTEKKVDNLTKLAAFRKEFIADVSHELKNPIFAAQGFVHTLLDGAVQDKTVRTRFLEKAAKSLDGLDVLVHDLLTLSHIEIGETKMHFEYFDLGGLVSDVIEQFEKRAADEQIKLVLHQIDKPLVVYADWVRIKQAMNNLVSNAINYSQEDSMVFINLEQDKDVVSVDVKDTGEGIPENDLDRIFERFYRVDKSRSREKGGTGLGLAIVKHIVEGHNSMVEVESKLGKGSTFRFTLPRGK